VIVSPFAFDTLSASKQLREAGMSEGVAEAVVSVFQHAAAMPDISHLATKADLDAQSAAMKADLEAQSAALRAALDAQGAKMKADLDAQGVRVKADLDLMKADIGALKRDMATKADLADLRAEFGARLLQQTLMMIGGVTALVTMVNVTLKIFE
jgi:hypothetical protein